MVLSAQAPAGIDGLDKAKFGMTEAEFQKIYPSTCDANKRCTAKNLVSVFGSFEQLQTVFYDGKLAVIEVNNNNAEGGVMTQVDYPVILLTRIYGTPAITFPNYPGGRSGFLTIVVWRFPDKSAISLEIESEPIRVTHSTRRSRLSL
jgi:hypothetical protein